MTLETLALMLGGEEKTQHAAKLNLLVKKKIKYMINEDLDVAKDFLDLVEILKQHKARVQKILRESMLTNKQGDSPQRSKLISEGEPMINVEGFDHMFSKDYYRLYKDGHLTKQEYNDARQEQQKEKKKEIDAMNHVRSL